MLCDRVIVELTCCSCEYSYYISTSGGSGHYKMTNGVCPSVCPSRLDLTRECKGLESPKLAGWKPMTRVTREPIQRSKGQRPRSHGHKVKKTMLLSAASPYICGGSLWLGDRVAGRSYASYAGRGHYSFLKIGLLVAAHVQFWVRRRVRGRRAGRLTSWSWSTWTFCCKSRQPTCSLDYGLATVTRRWMILPRGSTTQ